MNQKILGQSKAVKELTNLISRVSASKTNILIIGESGTGKELVARSIHDLSPVKDFPFVPVNCGAIAENLIESEMFGHKKGSFTGAVTDKIGLFEAANKGTLFLDEVGELPLALQVKLLRAIQERVIRRVGGIEDIRVDVRIIAATNRNLEDLVKRNLFREDLYYRLNVIQIKTPPLRDRAGDIELLAEVFLKRFAEKANKNITQFSEVVKEALNNYPWPGNIRELQNSIDRAVALEGQSQIQLSSLPQAIIDFQNRRTDKTSDSNGLSSGPSSRLELPVLASSSDSMQLSDVLLRVEKHYISVALVISQGSKEKASSLLGMSTKELRDRLKKLGL